MSQQGDCSSELLAVDQPPFQTLPVTVLEGKEKVPKSLTPTA